MPRRLPVIQNAAPEDAAASLRPPWQWTAIGAGLVFTIWIPLAMLATLVGRVASERVAGSSDPQRITEFRASASAGRALLYVVCAIGPVIASFVISCFAGGALVGRFGGRAGKNEAMLAGAIAALAAWLIAVLGGALVPWPVAVGSLLTFGVIGTLFGRLGGGLGVRRRPRV